MHRVRNSPWNPIVFALPSKNLDLRMREREIQRRKGSMKSHIQTYAAYSSSAWCYSLYPCLSFSFSLCLCCVCVYLLSFFCLSFFFHFFSLLKAPLIYKETRKPFSPIFSVNWSNHGQSCKGSAVLFFGPLTSVKFMPSPTFSFLIF